MEVVSRQELAHEKERFFELILSGSIFIHPTDTIYGLGCDATSDKAVDKIREIKVRQNMPFSVIVPSKEWIYENCIVSEKAKEWVEKLPGPYTLLLKLSKHNAISSSVNLGMDTVGVRIPKHWFSKVVEELDIPIVTTSANISGQEFMTSVDNLNNRVASRVDFILYEGEKRGNPSTLVRLIDDDVKVIPR